MSSTWYPQGNSHIEKAVQSVKNIYEKCHDVKMGLLLLNTTPVVSGHDHKAPCEVFFQCQLKTNLLIFISAKRTSVSNCEITPVMTSKYKNHDLVWSKVDPNTKWKPGKITNVLPNQSYIVHLEDGCELRRNEHHITGQHSNSANLPDYVKTSPEVKETHSSYNLRHWVKQRVIKWPQFQANFKESEFSIDNL